jgi:hypothetical protein
MSNWQFWKKVLVRAFIVFGFVTFSTFSSENFLQTVIFAVKTAGLYLFTEAIRFYGIKEYQPRTKKPKAKLFVSPLIY